MIASDLTERVAAAAFLADRRPQALPVALDGIGDLARRLIDLSDAGARPLRDAGECLAALLGTARHAHLRLNTPALNQSLAEMGRVAARVAVMELLMPPVPADAVRVIPAAIVSADRTARRTGMVRTFMRLVSRDGGAVTSVPFTLVDGGRR